MRWPFPGRRPWIVLPLSVAVDAYGKRRLILDARYLNAFLAYMPFSFEQLASLPGFTRVGDYIIIDDLKSGYHHARMAPGTWGYLGFEIDGELYVFTCLPFGVSQAPWAFTQVLQLVRSTRCKAPSHTLQFRTHLRALPTRLQHEAVTRL